MVRKGINYYYLRDLYNGNLPRPSLEVPRVFISHQKKDSEAARTIADYLQEAGIDVYFDQYDQSINRSDPQSVLRLKGVDKEKMPEYLKVVNTVMSIFQFNSLISNIRRTNRDQLILENRSFSESNATHVLNKIMDVYA